MAAELLLGPDAADALAVLAAWCAWCGLHSLLVCRRVQRAVSRRPLWRGGYRLAYNACSLLTLLPLLWWQHRLEQRLLFAWRGPWLGLRFLLLAYAVVMFTGGARVYDGGHFLGTRQWRSRRQAPQAIGTPLRTDGILACVRHPWYSGGIALLWALDDIQAPRIAVLFLLNAYLVLGALHEEHRLLTEIGEPYRRYRRQTPFLLPRRPVHCLRAAFRPRRPS